MHMGSLFIMSWYQTSLGARSATVLLISVYKEVRRTTSLLQVSTPRGNFIPIYCSDMNAVASKHRHALLANVSPG